MSSPVSTGEEKQQAADLKISEELVRFIRGFFSTPVISALGRLNATKIFFSKPVFSPQDFGSIPNKKLLQYSFDYLSRLGLLNEVDPSIKTYKLTEFGRQIFQRLSSFYAPHSYREYLYQFQKQLENAGPYRKQEVDRLENIIGSGRTHERYFPPAVSFLKRKVQFEIIADIGCGDGRFLDFVLKGIPGVGAVGIDLSEVSVRAAKENLSKKYPDRDISTLAADASHVKKWSEPLIKKVGANKLAISMWFLLHEISRREPQNVIQFLREVHKLFPSTPLVVGELVRQSPELLAKHRNELVMPEYLLFHDISEQGVLSWAEYKKILESVPYRLANERVFDEIGDDQAKEPATFVWCLLPE